MTIKEQRQEQIQSAIRRVQLAVADMRPEPYALGHAFLWGTVAITLKNGKTKSSYECLGSVCALDLRAVCRYVEAQVPGVSNVTYNLD